MKVASAIILTILLIYSAWAGEAPLNLDECVKTALENNTTMWNAQAVLEDYRLRKAVAVADFMPTVYASMDYTHQEYKTKYTPFQLQTPFFINREYSAGLNLSQTIWDGGYTIANYNKSKMDYYSSKYDFENVKQELIYSVEEAYINLLKQHQLLTVYEQTLESSSEALRKAESMEAVGAASRTDVLKAKVKMEEDKLNLIIAQTNLEVARANLNYLLGFDVNRQTEIVEIEPPQPLELEYEEAVKIALENHPALKKAKYDLESAEKVIVMARSTIMPQLTGSYRFGYSSPAFDDMARPFDSEYNWSAMVTLSVRLFDGLSTYANIDRAKVGKRSADDNLEQVRLDVTLEVKVAYLGLEEARKSITVARQRVISAEEDLRLSTARYELEAGTILELIDAQVALTSAQYQKIQAEYDYWFAQSRLMKAMGKLK